MKGVETFVFRADQIVVQAVRYSWSRPHRLADRIS